MLSGMWNLWYTSLKWLRKGNTGWIFSWVRSSWDLEAVKKDQGPEVVFDNGEESNKRMKRMLRPIKIAIVVAVLAIAAFDSFYTLSENEMAVLTTFGRPSSVTTSGPSSRCLSYRRYIRCPRKSRHAHWIWPGLQRAEPCGQRKQSNFGYVRVRDDNQGFNFVNVDFTSSIRLWTH